MKRFIVVIVGCAGFLFGTLFTYYGKAAQSSQTGEGATSQVLVQEIRALRTALQDFTTSHSRLQFAVERYRVQELLVDRLTDEYNTIQSQIDSNEDLIQQAEESAKNLERAVSIEADSLRRDEIERERKSINTNMEINKHRNQRLEERRIHVAGSLQTEKAKLTELRSALDLLDRSFSNQQAERK